MTNIFVVLLTLFAILSIGSAFMIPQANVEGMENKCSKPSEMDGDCKTVYQSKSNPKKFVKECRGEPNDMKYESDCPYSWYIDSGRPAGICKKTDGNLAYIRKHGKCPPHNLGPGGTQHMLGPGGTQHMLGPGGTEKKMGGCSGTRYGCCPDGTTARKHAGDKCHSGKPHPHRRHGKGRRVPNNMDNNRYKKFIPSDLDELAISREMYEEIGKDFMKDEARKKGVNLPYIHDSEAEVLGRMVWRVYVAEIDQKRANSPKAADEVIQREIQLLNKVSKIMKTQTDGHKGKKHHSVAAQASGVPNCNPLAYANRRTTNQYGYRPPSSHDIKREPGQAFEGRPIHGSPRYYDITNAIEHCFKDRACGGVNFDATTGEYTLMPVHARISKRPHYTAIIKNKHSRPTDPKDNTQKHHHHHSHHHSKRNSPEENPYVPITGIGYSGNQYCGGDHPRDPNLMPRPYNSIMDLFH